MIKILHNKISVPVSLPKQILRTQLLKKLADSERYSLTLLQAPAGYGKSTLTLQWLKQMYKSHFAWLSLDQSDNDPSVFWAYVFASLSPFFPVLETSLEALKARQLKSEDALAQLLANFSLETPVYFVLDNYHLINNPILHQEINQLIEQCPALFHVVILMRSYPECLPIQDMQVYQKILTFNHKDLAFTADEILSFFQHKQILVSEKNLATLKKKTAGWPLGLQLVYLAHTQNTHINNIEDIFKHKLLLRGHLLPVLGERIFCDFSPERKAFLLDICTNEHFSLDLCQVLSDIPNLSVHLECLNKDGLISLLSFDPEPVYTFQPLFLEWLRYKLSQQPAAEKKQNLKSARYYQKRGDYEKSLGFFLEARAHSEILSFLESVIPDLHASYETSIIIRLCSMVSEELLLESSDLTLSYGLSLINGLETDLAKSWMHKAQKHPETFALLKAALSASRRQTDQTLLELKLIRHSGKQSVFFKEAMFKIKVFSLMEQNQYDEAISILEPLFSFPLYTHSRLGDFGWRHLYVSYLIRGKLTQAHQFLHQLLESPSFFDQDHSTYILAVACQADLNHKQNHRARSQEFAKKVLHFPGCGGYFLKSLVSVFYVFLGCHQYDKCADVLNIIDELVRQQFVSGSTYWEKLVEKVVLDLKLAQGEYRAADLWFENHIPAFEKLCFTGLDSLYDIQRFCYCCFYRNQFQMALDFLDHKYDEIKNKGVQLFLAPVCAFRAYTHYTLGNFASAQSDITQALLLSEQQQFTSWLTDGLCEFKVLLENIEPNSGVSPGFLNDAYLWVNATEHAYPLTLKKPILLLIEKLSPREEEILLIILKGKSNEEIAKQLCISKNTLKTHIRHLYQKLAVKNRQMLKSQVSFESIIDKQKL